MNFVNFKSAVSKHFKDMTKDDFNLFRVDIPGDVLWETYLSSFPEGSNPIFRERTHHDCNCCKSFIRAMGNVVSIKGDNLVSLWDVDLGEEEKEYQVVADALSALVKGGNLLNKFLHTEHTVGTDKSFGDITTWEHFFLKLPDKFFSLGSNIGPSLGESRSTFDVFFRGLSELTVDSIQTTLELINQNSLYRGEEHKFVLSEFLKQKTCFDKANNKDLFVWETSSKVPPSVSRIRNTSIGTLLVDLSAGEDLEKAVKSFEQKVAPSNYKRPTAIVTKAMIEKAKEKIEELGLTSALNRRYADLTDISINDILFVDRSVKNKMLQRDVFAELTSSVQVNVKKFSKVEEVGIEDFISKVLPTASSLEALFENRFSPNLMSLIAPEDLSSKNLFKWDNNFSWTYNGDLADSIKERVKAAGGDVLGEFCCRLAWFNYDDLDVSMLEPDGYRIYFSNRQTTSPSGGRLDVDMNAGAGHSRTPVENIFYRDLSKMKDGIYSLQVHNYRKRETKDEGFEVEVDIQGELHTFSYPKAVKNDERITVARFRFDKKKKELKIETSYIDSSSIQKTIWNIQSGQFHPVNLMLLSPNHWNEPGIGNKHYFFILNDCQNDGTARGFYNEFLRGDLDAHRKVIEMVGSKMKTDESKNQLSGIGFSSTQRNHLFCKVTGSFDRVVKVVF